MAKKINWHKLAEAATELPWQSNNMLVTEVAGKKVTLAQADGRVYAFAYKCPHASGVMADGFIDAMGNVVCPLHRYKFNMQNGRNVTGEGYYLKTYTVEQREEGLFLGMEESGLFGWL